MADIQQSTQELLTELSQKRAAKRQGGVIPPPPGGQAFPVIREAVPGIQEAPELPVEEQSTLELLQELSQRKAATQQKQIVEQPQEETDFFDRLKGLFTGEDRATPETEAAPELTAQIIGRPGQRPSLKEFILAGRMLLTATEEEKKKLIEETVPDAAFRTDEKGNTFVTLPGREEAVLNRPGFSLEDALNITGMVALFTPAGRVARGLGFGMRTFIRGGAAGLTEAGREIAVEKDLDPVEIGLAGATGVIGESIVPTVKAVGRGLRRGAGVIPAVRAIPGIGTPAQRSLTDIPVPVEDLPAAEAVVREGREISAKAGIDLAPAQLTLDPEAIRTTSLLAELPGAVRPASEFLETQNRQAFDAVDRFLDTLAIPESVELSAQRLQTAAKEAIAIRNTVRERISQPIYAEAFLNKSPVLLRKTLGMIADFRKKFPPGKRMDKMLESVSGLISTKPAQPGQSAGLTLEQLHGAKLELGDMLELGRESGFGRTAKRFLGKVKDQMTKELNEISPAYKRATTAFREASPPVDALEKTIIGKIVDFNEFNVDRIADTLFNPKNNPATIRNARKVIEEVDPQAWLDISRSRFESLMGGLEQEAQLGATRNAPAAILRKLFGNDKQQKVLFAGLDEETAKNMRWLKKGLERAEEARPGGSATAGRLPVLQRIEELGAPKRTFVRRGLEKPIKSFGALSADILSGFQGAGDTARDAAINMAEVYFNPKWRGRLRAMRKLTPGSPEAAGALSKLISDVSVLGKASAQPIQKELRE